MTGFRTQAAAAAQRATRVRYRETLTSGLSPSNLEPDDNRTPPGHAARKSRGLAIQKNTQTVFVCDVPEPVRFPWARAHLRHAGPHRNVERVLFDTSRKETNWGKAEN